MTVKLRRMATEDDERIYFATVRDRRGRLIYEASGPLDALRDDIAAVIR